jgi:aryl-alcohol dehydrogenase-like predicted oxidoreductase
MNRRNFLGKASVAGAVVLSGNLTLTTAAAEQAIAADTSNSLPTPQSFRQGEMIYRTLGSTGEKVSAIGLGGFHISKPKTDEEAVQLTKTAIDRGITFMDNCWDYAEGVSEMRMGKALKNGYRQKVFLMSKIDGRDKKSAAKQIDESLLRLDTDRIDLMQFHEIIRFEDPDKIFAEGGAFEAMSDAKKAGKIRYIGFTGHKNPAIHLQMLEIANTHNFKFDAVQLPLNVMDAHFRSFEKQVLPKLVEAKIGVLGMKSLGDPFILNSKTVTAPEALRYSLSLPTSVVITGIEKMEILEQALTVAKNFKQMSQTEMTALLAKTRDAAMTGKFERFKTDNHFDGTAKNPKWLGGMQES